ncbi:protein kinase domain-containing protein [Haloplanus salinarum]|uniref:protein kinase domain-containing protein n=1 Tax=Haloplanus salinarum TaxID=1912324 RepID=UPI00214CAEA5|nr:protein kinase [Haloplanus salinarum]
MPGPADDDRIPEAVAPHTLSDFGYGDLEKGKRIGTGGDADVYRATLDQDGYTYPIAVKEPRFEGTIRKRVFQRFETEAETWESLNHHENVVSVYTWGAEPLPWLALEFMDGGTLEAQLGSIDVAEALWLSGRIAEGIRYGHRHGVAHLDIKPTNVLLRDTPEGKWDYPKVSDWGWPRCYWTTPIASRESHRRMPRRNSSTPRSTEAPTISPTSTNWGR